MREILYRAKAINRDNGYYRTSYKNGDWVYGLLTRLYDERFEAVPAEMKNTNGVSGIEVDYKTIGQYIGANDKNHKDIFEGDIVKSCDNHIYRIKWDNQRAMFYLRNDITHASADFYHYFASDLEIIGNITDNPELLKGGESND